MSVKKHYLNICFIIIAGIIVYSNTFNASFHYDDIPVIVDNIRIRDITSYFPPLGQRDVGFLSFAVNYYFGGLDVAGYHIVNLIIHLLNGCILYFLVLNVFRTPFFSSNRKNGYARFTALTTALLFLLHPLQTQAVTYIAQRFASLATLFYLISLFCYIQYRIEDHGRRAFSFYVIAILSAVIAMRTKEIAFTIPVMILMIELLFFRATLTKRVIMLFPFLLTMVIIPIGLIDVGHFSFEKLGNISERTIVTEEGVSLPRDVYIITQLRVIITYLRLIFFPVNQTLEYDYPRYASLTEYPVLISCAVLLLFAGLGCFLVYYTGKARKNENSWKDLFRFVSFGIFWFFIAISVESFMISITHVIFEHRMYLPSIGIFLSVVPLTIYFILNIRHGRILAYALVIVLLIVLGTAAYARNSVWRSEVTLWEDGVRKAPMRTGPHYHLGVAYLKEGKPKEALNELQLASLLGTDYPSIYFMTGQAYESLGWLPDAEKAYRKAVELNGKYLLAHDRLAVLFYRNNDLVNALKEYEIILSLKPDNDIVRKNIDMIMNMLKSKNVSEQDKE